MPLTECEKVCGMTLEAVRGPSVVLLLPFVCIGASFTRFLLPCCPLSSAKAVRESIVFDLGRGATVIVAGALVGPFGVGDCGTGSEKPRNLPRLATPTPHVNVVRYPEQSFPISRHCEQYGRRRSQVDPDLAHVWQSSAAPVAGTRRLLFFSKPEETGLSRVMVLTSAAAILFDGDVVDGTC